MSAKAPQDSPGYVITNGVRGSALEVQGDWRPNYPSLLRDQEIKGLVLNYALGWDEQSVDFLTDLDCLEALTVVSRRALDLGPLRSLNRLRFLKIVAPLASPVDFTPYTGLEQLVFHWIRESKGLSLLGRLDRLWLSNFPAPDLSSLAELHSLEALEVVGSPLESLAGVEDLTRLRALGLHNLKKLSSLDGLTYLERLVELEVTYCPRVHDLGPIECISTLVRLSISDCGKVQSFAPISKLKQLETLLFVGTTYVVDGNLSVLLELPRLREVYFQNRRHYSHKRETLQAILNSTLP